ncbi:MAG TPA: RluA family pseudouridine synthase [Spirochaetia bacterium]|nr:RluA family pseudouridine synthase [Spirochaetia bacterium]
MARRYRKLIAGTNDGGKRIDAVLRRALPHLPLSRIYRALRNGEIRIDGLRARADRRIDAGATIEVSERLIGDTTPEGDRESCQLQETDTGSVAGMIVRETPNLVVLNKPRGVPVQGGGNIRSLPLDEQVRRYLASKIESSLSFHPGPLHRLDRNTSGLVVFSVSVEGARRFTRALRTGEVRKFYLALLAGRLPGTAIWRDALIRNEVRRITEVAAVGPESSRENAARAKAAETRVTPLFSAATPSGPRTLALCRIVTGRTHQIRAHAAAHGYPLVGDRKYGGPPGEGGYTLHAYRIELTGSDPLPEERVFTAPPGRMQRESIMDAFHADATDETGRQLASALSDEALNAAKLHLETPAANERPHL